MKLRFLILGLSLASYCFAQSPNGQQAVQDGTTQIFDTENKDVLNALNNPAPPSIPVIYNSYGEKYTKIENFDYAIILPNTGYKQTTSNLVSKFENEASNATITVKQYVSESVDIARPMTKDYILNNKKCEVIYSMANGMAKQTLVLCESLSQTARNAIVIEAACSKNDTRTYNQLERCLLSLVPTVDNPITEDGYYTNSAFSIATEGFKLQRNGLLSTIFTQSGNFEKEKQEGNNVYFQVVRQKGGIAKGKQKKDAVKKVNDTYSENNKASKPKKVTINGMNGYEFDIETKDKNGKTIEKGYAVSVYTDNAQYLMVSGANKDIDNNITKFKKIARTLKNK